MATAAPPRGRAAGRGRADPSPSSLRGWGGERARRLRRCGGALRRGAAAHTRSGRPPVAAPRASTPHALALGRAGRAPRMCAAPPPAPPPRLRSAAAEGGRVVARQPAGLLKATWGRPRPVAASGRLPPPLAPRHPPLARSPRTLATTLPPWRTRWWVRGGESEGVAGRGGGEEEAPRRRAHAASAERARPRSTGRLLVPAGSPTSPPVRAGRRSGGPMQARWPPPQPPTTRPPPRSPREPWPGCASRAPTRAGWRPGWTRRKRGAATRSHGSTPRGARPRPPTRRRLLNGGRQMQRGRRRRPPRPPRRQRARARPRRRPR